MPRNFGSITWLLPVIIVAPLALAHCGGAKTDSATADPGPTDDAGMKAGNDASDSDSGTKAMPPGDDGGTATPPGDDGGTATPPGDDGGTATPPGDDGGTSTPPGDDGGTTTSPDAGGSPGTPGSVTCNGSPCDVSRGYVCCVTLTCDGPAEACIPPHGFCLGHAIACDETADCNEGVCCQDLPSFGLPGAASCKASCSTHICR